MTIRDLRIFCAVAEQGSMSKAAELLDCAQPTVSNVVSRIETDYGVRLFERLSNRLYITEDGAYLNSHARNLLELYDEIENNLGSRTQPVSLRVGATITVGSSIMPSLASSFGKDHKKIRLEVVVDNTRTVEQLLLEGKLDLALVEGTVTRAELQAEPVLDDELILVMAPSFPFGPRKRCTASDLEGMPFVLREEGSGTRERFVRFLSDNKVRVRETWVSHSPDSIINAVTEGLGMTVISKRLVRSQLRDGSLREVRLQGASFSRSFSLVYHKDKFFSPPMDALAEEIRNLSRSDG